MRRILTCLAVLLGFAAAMWAQTPEEIIARMEKAMDPAETQGMSMVVDFKIPILGTSSSTVFMLGEMVKSETTILGHKLVTFSDGTTEWEYDSHSNELTIQSVKEKDEGSEAEMFNEIADGYDIKLKKQTADAWYLECRKSKANTDKDAPDKMELVVSRKTDLPISLTARMSGVKITLRDVVIGISPSLMHFNPADYPDAKVIDKR